MQISFSVFTKPWHGPLEELADRVKALGFDGIELPVRPSYPVTPENVEVELPKAAELFRQRGLTIASVAGPTDEATFAACAQAGIPIVRICVAVGDEGYLASEAALQREFEGLVPLLDRYGVTLGVQNHSGRSVCNAQGLRVLLRPFEREHVAAVWDAAHNALNGEEPELALDLVWDHLCMVNLKNAYWRRTTGPESDDVVWQPYWTTGRQGLASWPRVAAEMRRRRYTGVVCLTAEYTDELSVDRLIAEDLAYAKGLFG
jgi:sugar phosphate isomerase/epimerase